MGIRVVARVYVARDGVVAGGSGLIKILEAIDAEGSLSGAARRLGMNYRRLWARLRSAERLLGVKLVERGRRSGSRLTPEARKLVNEYKSIVELLTECMGEDKYLL